VFTIRYHLIFTLVLTCYISPLTHPPAFADSKPSSEKTAQLGSEQELLNAITLQANDKAQELLKQGINVNLRISPQDTTFLMHAVQNEAVEIALLLLRSGADVHAKDKSGKTAIEYARYTGSSEMIKLLVNHGCDISSALTVAVSISNLTLVKELLQKGADPNTVYEDITILQHAVVKASYSEKTSEPVEIISELINYGANVNIVSNGLTALFYALVSTNTSTEEIVDLLLRNGANPGYVNTTGLNALLLYTSNPQPIPSIIDLLVRYGVDVNAYTHTIRPVAFSLEPSETMAEVLETLINNGANIHAVADSGTNVLMALLKNAKHSTMSISPAVDVLVKHGININAQSNFGWTALMIAVENSDLETILILIKNGAKTNLTNKQGETALDLAKKTNQPEIIKTLLSASSLEKINK
jgi:ankyrin repeat protein